MGLTKNIGGVLAGLSVIVVGGVMASACAAPTSDPTSQSSEAQSTTVSAEEAQAQDVWRETIARNPTTVEGCFHTSYPSTDWAQVDCGIAPNRPFLKRQPATGDAPETVGNGNDYSAQVSGLITQTVGTFPTVKGVTSESDGTANTYSIQLNSNFMTKARCHTISGCNAWQQFVYSSSSEQAFMQYWLIGQGTCPDSTWMDAGGGDCYKNSAGVNVPQLPISDLSTMKMSGSAVKGGLNTLVFTAKGEAYSVTGKDSVVELALDWNASEFNIIGDGDASEATFNAGSSVTVKIAVTSGSTAAPVCTANTGTTGETNNLTAGACTATGGSTPYVEFTESR